MDEIIISYQKKEPTNPATNKMIIRKIMISFMIGFLNLAACFILFGVSFSVILSDSSFLFLLFILVSQLLFITMLSIICEMTINKTGFFQVIVTIILQVAIPTIMMIPFDQFYGILILTCFYNAVVFTIIDYMVRIVSKKRIQKRIES